LPFANQPSQPWFWKRGNNVVLEPNEAPFLNRRCKGKQNILFLVCTTVSWESLIHQCL
jgi:hypothetical protein